MRAFDFSTAAENPGEETQMDALIKFWHLNFGPVSGVSEGVRRERGQIKRPE
jgi:hypothetical protein